MLLWITQSFVKHVANSWCQSTSTSAASVLCLCRRFIRAFKLSHILWKIVRLWKKATSVDYKRNTNVNCQHLVWWRPQRKCIWCCIFSTVQACSALRKCWEINTLVSRLDEYHTCLNWMSSEKNIKHTSKPYLKTSLITLLISAESVLSTLSLLPLIECSVQYTCQTHSALVYMRVPFAL